MKKFNSPTLPAKPSLRVISRPASVQRKDFNDSPSRRLHLARSDIGSNIIYHQLLTEKYLQS